MIYLSAASKVSGSCSTFLLGSVLFAVFLANATILHAASVGVTANGFAKFTPPVNLEWSKLEKFLDGCSDDEASWDYTAPMNGADRFSQLLAGETTGCSKWVDGGTRTSAHYVCAFRLHSDLKVKYTGAKFFASAFTLFPLHKGSIPGVLRSTVISKSGDCATLDMIVSLKDAGASLDQLIGLGGIVNPKTSYYINDCVRELKPGSDYRVDWKINEDKGVPRARTETFDYPPQYIDGYYRFTEVGTVTVPTTLITYCNYVALSDYSLKVAGTGSLNDQIPRISKHSIERGLIPLVEAAAKSTISTSGGGKKLPDYVVDRFDSKKWDDVPHYGR